MSRHKNSTKTSWKNKIHGSLQCGLGIIGFVCRRSTWLKHLLHQVEADARFALVLSHGEVVEQVKMSHVGAVRVSVLVHQPFPLAGVGVSRADVLRLEMLQLTVDVVSVRHDRSEESHGGSEQRREDTSKYELIRANSTTRRHRIEI